MPTRRDLVIVGISLFALGACAVVGWWLVRAFVDTSRPVDWTRAEVDAEVPSITIWYEPPCGSVYERADVELDDGRAVVTVFVDGWALFCTQEYRETEVHIALDEPVDESLVVVDGSRS